MDEPIKTIDLSRETLRNRLNSSVREWGNQFEPVSLKGKEYKLGNILTADVLEYVVDCSAATTFYTPLFIGIEGLVAGMDSEEIVQSRAFATVTHFSVMRPYGLFRQWTADKFGLSKESNPLVKFGFDTTAFVFFQIPCYTGILKLAEASWDEVKIALPAGIAIGIITGRPFGYFMDKWRKHWGTKPTLE